MLLITRLCFYTLNLLMLDASTVAKKLQSSKKMSGTLINGAEPNQPGNVKMCHHTKLKKIYSNPQIPQPLDLQDLHDSSPVTCHLSPAGAGGCHGVTVSRCHLLWEAARAGLIGRWKFLVVGTTNEIWCSYMHEISVTIKCEKLFRSLA